MNLKEYIKNKRESLSQSSVNTYYSILFNLYKKVFGKEDEMDYKKFDDSKDILDHLKNLPPNRRKTILSALVVITSNKNYRDLMMNDIKDYNADMSKQEKSETQKDNWVEQPAIKSLWEELKKNSDLLYKKTKLSSSDLQQIQSFIIISLLGGVFIPVRRSLDFCKFKIKDINKEKDNYLDKSTLVFNVYKTAKTYGKQELPIPSPLKSILTKWVKNNPTEYLLFDTNMNPLNAIKLNQRLNKLFENKKISINALRHSYLTNLYGDTIKQNEEIAKTMGAMGSSSSMAINYIKKAD